MRHGLITDFLSSVGQRESALYGIVKEDVYGVARFDTMLFGGIVLPDSHLFDGSLLLDLLEPRGLADAVGHTPENPTVEIRMRGRDFESSLCDWLWDASAGLPRPLEFRYFRDASREASFAHALSTARAGEVPDSITTAVTDAMIDHGISKDVTRRLRDAWSQWSREGSDLGIFGKWPSTPFPLSASIVERMPRSAFHDPKGYALQRDVMHLVTRRGDTRSASVDAILRDARVMLDYTNANADIELVRTWYADARQVAIATQHRCNLATRPSDVSAIVAALADDTTVTTTTGGEVDSQAVMAVVGELSLLSVSEFRTLMAQTAAERRAFLVSHTRSALTALMKKAVEFLRPSSKSSDGPWFGQERVLLPTATSVAGWMLDGPPAAVAAGVLTVGLHSGAHKVSELLTHRTRVRSLVRWVDAHHAI